MQITVPEAMRIAVDHHRQGRFDQAEELYRLILQVEPENPDAMAMLGTLLSQRGRNDDALDFLERALKLKPDAADFHANHGLVLFTAGRVDAALEAYRKALALRSDVPNVHYNIGNALQSIGLLDEAVENYRKAIALRGNDAHAWCNLGSALLKQDKVADAIESFHRAIESEENYAEAMSNLGAALARSGKLDEAIQWYARASALRPDSPEIANNYAGALKDAGRLEEALVVYRRSLAAAPHPVVHSNLVFLLHYQPDNDARSILQELTRWNQIYAAPRGKDVATHLNHSVADRRLKIGYLSPNFFDQAEAHFVLPLLAAHDRHRVQIHCFSNVRKPDHLTRRHRELADAWHDISRMDDQAADKLIRENSIDILVDLAMHMGDNRLLLMAQKPAPVQAAWLAYPGSTGLAAIDYRFTDPFLDPPGSDESVYSEKSLRLSETWICYDPLSEAPPRPPQQRGPITFGSLNNPCKINPLSLRAWAQILRQIPGSRLLVLSESDEQRLRIRRIFEQVSVAADRLEFVAHLPRDQYLRLYERIDLALDPLPYNGITTTCDALWMGVPVVTQKGRTAAGRAGASILANAGLSELIADSQPQFIQLAVNLAKDLPRLEKMRAGLRERLAQSPVMDAGRFARNLKGLYQQMWSQWCAQFDR
jgi:predicted O-linked N-acetylglucosamine transferase (SPINDLY family)